MPLTIEIVCPCSETALRCVVEGLVALNFAMMSAAAEAGTPCPPLYSSGIRYKRERRRKEQWQNVAELLVSREGDCEDLAGYRAAELRREGELAMVDIRRTRRGSFHAVVIRGDGSTEDPSRILLDMDADHTTEV